MRSDWLCAECSTERVGCILDALGIVHILQMKKIRLRESAQGQLNTTDQAVISTLGRLKQGDCHESKAILAT